MLRIISIIFPLFLALSSCHTHKVLLPQTKFSIQFSKGNTQNLNYFAFNCIDQEYPNKMGHVLQDSASVTTPKVAHPSFYGCFDWHSSVHGHWTLVTLINTFPDLQNKDSIILKLKKNITAENILKEIDYFKDLNKNYERTYGWAWLLKLDEALRDSNLPEFQKLQKNLSPLTDTVASKFVYFLKKLNHPIRVGTHTNTAFGLSFAYDYAQKHHPELKKIIESKAKQFYLSDEGCPLKWEPSGFDFLSPCLQEVSLMNKILNKKEFIHWLDKFLPNFRKDPSKYLQPAVVSDPTDGHMAHLDGLNYSRAWCLYELNSTLQNGKFQKLAKAHFDFSFNKLDSGEYMGSHWLASFATYALTKGN